VSSHAKKPLLMTALFTLFVAGVSGSASAIIINDSRGHALLPLAAGQVGRINIANVGDPNISNSCLVKVSFFAADGSVMGNPETRLIRPGASDFVDFADRTIPIGGRRTFRAVIELDRTIPPGPCLVQEEVFEKLTGRTQLIGDPGILPTGDPPEPEKTSL